MHPEDQDTVGDDLENQDEPKVADGEDVADGDEQSSNAESSTAEDVSKPAEADTASIVRDVVDPNKAAASSASEESGRKTDDKDATKEPDNENYSDVPFNKHPRFQEVLGRLKTAETDAIRYRNVEDFIANQGLTGEEAAEMLEIAGLIKTDPVKAWAAIKPRVQQLLIAAGEVLPGDLKAKVQAGEMSREAAMEVSRNRAAMQSADVRREWEGKRAQERQQTDTRNAILGAVNSWHAERQSRDPNFEQKLPALQKEIAWLQTKEGRPDTPEGVRKQLQKAYDAVSATYQSPQSKPRPKRPVTSGQQASGSVQPEISSTLDAVRAVVAKRAAA